MPITDRYPRVAIIVLPVLDVEQATEWVVTNLDPIGGESTFVAQLSPDGYLPVTHYWCNWRCTQEEFDILKLEFGPICYSDIDYPDSMILLSELGLVPMAEVEIV